MKNVVFAVALIVGFVVSSIAYAGNCHVGQIQQVQQVVVPQVQFLEVPNYVPVQNIIVPTYAVRQQNIQLVQAHAHAQVQRQRIVQKQVQPVQKVIVRQPAQRSRSVERSVVR